MGLRNQIAHCSAEFFGILGLPAEDGVMTAGEWGRFVHPDDRERMAAHLAARARRRRTARRPTIASPPLTARTRWLSYAGQIRRTPDGDRMLGTVVDITDRKRLEAELRITPTSRRESRRR